MKRHSFIAALTAFAMCLTSFLILPAYALSIGDVDKDNKITASDARIILRVSVGLENVDEGTRTAADVDNDNKVTASDARLVLRVSVGLDKLPDAHEHKYRYEQIKDEKGNVNELKCLRICDGCGEKEEVDHVFGELVEDIPPTCKLPGSGYRECINCGYQAYELIPAGRHSYETIEEVKKTCTTPGYIKEKCTLCGNVRERDIPASHNPGPAATCTSAQVCLDCGAVLAPAFGHKIDNYNIGVTTGIKCSRCGEEVIPSFNDLVNSIKFNTEDKNRFSGFSESNGEFKAPEYSNNAVGSFLKTMLEKELKNQVGKSNKASFFTKNRLLTNSNFPVPGETFVSSLEESDVKSIKFEKTNNIDFVKGLSDSYKDPDGNIIDLTGLKSSSPAGNFYKITVVLNDEKYTSAGNNKETSAIDKIYQKNYNKSLEQMLSPDKQPDLGGIMKMDGSISTDFNVIYYFNAETLKPVAAKYYLGINVVNQLNAYIGEDDKVSNTPTGYVKLNIINNNTDYYFFNNNFDVSALPNN